MGISISQFDIFQDMLIPLQDLKSTIELFHRELDLYPLWLCPLKLLAQVNGNLNSKKFLILNH